MQWTEPAGKIFVARPLIGLTLAGFGDGQLQDRFRTRCRLVAHLAAELLDALELKPGDLRLGSLGSRRLLTPHMSWRELITGIYEGRPHPRGIAGRPEFCPATMAANIAAAEAALLASLPGSLRSLLLETNGVMDMMAIDGGDWFESMWLLWKIEEVVEQNRYYRGGSAKGLYERDFTNLVFFASAGTDGILFAFPVVDGCCDSRVMVWRPIMDELDELAPTLEEFLRGWLMGTISV